ncbi:MAG: YidC/Oxa1 family membrane protein insertase, partial [Oscillospiraceae bacterium]|nr:YidC/Oxa1 family membrane protein insertase [Oscillospiraceae bacterium]
YKGKQNMMQMNSMNAEMQRLQKQYGKDQQRYQQELQKLYEEEQVNPMGGCLWSLLPLPIMMGLYYVIRKPMLYMLCLTEDQISAVKEALVAAQSGILDGVNQAYEEIRIMSVISQDSSLYQVAANALGDAADKLQTINFNFLGINLGAIPTWKFWTWESMSWSNIGLFLIPIAVTVLNFLYSQYSMKSSQIKNGDEKKEEAAAAANQSTKTMMMVMPLMYLWFGYIMPAGMCIYMACNAIFSALQELIFSKFLNKKFAAEEEARKARLAERREQEKAKKAEIAARRAAEQEELAKRGKKAVKQAQKKQLDSGAGAIGVRRYARGRAFDPDRYPTTPYRDPQDVLDEEALERALSKRGKKQAAEELPTETPAETVSAANDDNEE